MRPTNGTSVSRSKTRSVIAHALRSCSSSLSSFTARSFSTTPLVGTRSSAAVAQHLVERRTRARARSATRPESMSASSAIRFRFVSTGSTPSTALRGLDVAEVGEEPRAVLLDEERAVRALEAAEVADVRRVGDEQRLLEALAEAGDAVGHAFSFRYWSA